VRSSEITEVLSRPVRRELLARDITRLAYTAKDGTPRNAPIGFTWHGSYMVMCTAKNAPKLWAPAENPMVALTIDTPRCTHPRSC
jgi:nitroimidazol reductase NimA-like FMN-containing flavoprotein (pyridoxamine 5'-phosphate oxidase superfamily)